MFPLTIVILNLTMSSVLTTFINVYIENKPIHAYIDTGATLCFAQENVCTNWIKLRQPRRFTIADKSEHFIHYVAKEVVVIVSGTPFIAKTIYQYDTGIKLIIGNNFLKLYQPFTQYLDKISITHPKIGKVFTKIITKDIIRIIADKLRNKLIIQLYLLNKENLGKLLDIVSSDNPLDTIKNKNTELVQIFLKDPKHEVNVPNNIIYNVRDVKEFTEEAQKLLELGIIRESRSPHSAPAFYVENHNEIKRNKRRMVINYKRMNDATIGDSYKLPHKDYIIEKLKGKNVYTSFDAKSGYWQLRLHENTKPLTAFSCPPQKHYEWNVLPFGLKQAPAIYQRFMDTNFAGLENFCLVYIDDILVFSDNENDHYNHVEQVLHRIKDKGLVISKTKTQLYKKEIEYLGLKFGENGTLNLSPHTKEKILLFPDKLEDRKQIQRFLGCLNYIADQGFLKDFATQRAVLQKMISPNIPWFWGEEATQAVKTLKNSLHNLPQLYNPVPNDFLIVETDASNHTWSGCMLAIPNGKTLLNLNEFGEPLTQQRDAHSQQNGASGIQKINDTQKIHCLDSIKSNKLEKKLCKYTAGTFSQAEINYTVHEKEVLAIIRTLEKWQIDLKPTRFELHTDSKYAAGFVQNNFTGGRNEGRLVKWQLRLSQFTPYVKYIKSEQNCFADTLTREWSTQWKQ
nr:polymerase [Chrysanthemum yellow edge associated virus 1]